MALGNLKGDYYEDLDSKYSLMKDLVERPYIEKCENFGNLGFYIKVKDLKYKNYSMPMRILTPRPTPIGFGKEEKHYDGNNFIVQTSGKYFHDMLEIVPQLITLKRTGEKFKVILLAPQQIDPNTKMFYGMNPEDQTNHQPISYWRDILKYLRLDFECVEAKAGDSYSTESNYFFYYSDLGIGKKLGFGFNPATKHKQVVPNLMPELQIENCYIIYPLMYFTTLIHADAYDILSRGLAPLINKPIPGKKIFVSRDSSVYGDRSIKNSQHLTEFMREKGFEIFNQEDYIWQEQIKKITSAQYVVSLVGSGFINASLSGPGSTMISIHTDKSQDFLTYANQAGRSDIDFKTVYCDPDGLDIIRYLNTSKSKITREVMDGRI